MDSIGTIIGSSLDLLILQLAVRCQVIKQCGSRFSD